MIKSTSLALLFVSAIAGAQTVTVGSTTSTQNGNTTTITVPVSVAVPPAATTTASPSMAALRVDVGDGTGSSTGQAITTAFKTIALPHVVTDTASGWNASANTYTVPTTGTYLIVSSIRFVDSVASGISYGQGVNTSNVDNTSFFWTTTAGMRNGSQNLRIMQLSAGQTINLFAYVDSPNALLIASASLNIQQLP